MQTILAIDDDESLRDTIGVMLEQEGFRAVLAGDGKAGFENAVTLKLEPDAETPRHFLTVHGVGYRFVP